jgi:hypothetical protein
VSPGDESDQEALNWAGAVYGLNGVRLLVLNERMVIGVWSDLDGPHIRHAIEIFHGADAPLVRYLDGPGIPDIYKARKMKGTPVPLDILQAMVDAPSEPWLVRDKMLKEIGWHAKVHVYAP